MRAFALIILGLISGILCVFSDYVYKEAIFTLIPGILYGISLGLFYLIEKKINILKIFFFVITSGFAYYAAFWTTFIVFIYTMPTPDWSHPSSSPQTNLPFYCLIAGGIVGGVILSLSIRLFLEKIPFQKGLFLTLGSGILSLSWFLIPSRVFPDPFYANTLGLFICWQVGMNLLLNFLPNKYK